MVVAVLVAVLAALSLVELLDSNQDEPEGLIDFISLVVLVVALPSLALLLLAVSLRRRSVRVVASILAASLVLGGLLVVPTVMVLATVLLGDEPVVPPDDTVRSRGVVVYTHDLAAPVDTAVLVPGRVAFRDLRSAQDRVDAAVNELVGSRAPAGRRTYWSTPCSRTYTGVVRVEGDTVEVDLLGPPRPTTPSCRLTARERRLREQQLAWTVQGNLDVPARTIRVRESGVTTWTVLRADPAYVEHR